MSCDNSVAISAMTDVWNATGNYKVAIQMDVTDIDSAGNSRLIDLLIGGSSKFGVDKQGCIQTACTGLWLQNTSNNGFGANSTIPSIYISSGTVLNFNSTSVYPTTSFGYDIGNSSNLFRNIYQTTHSTGVPTTSEYANSGAWGVHNDTLSDTRYLAFNNSSGIDYISFDVNSFTGVLVDGTTITGDGINTALVATAQHNTLLIGKDEGVPFATGVTGINFAGAGVSAGSIVDGLWEIVIDGTAGGGGTSLTVFDEGSTLHTGVSSIDFVGPMVTATNIGSAITVTLVESFTGVNTTSSITGDGNSNPIGVLVSTDSDNLTSTGTDGGIFTTTPATGNFFTGVLVDGTTVTGDGINIPLVSIANSFTGVTVDNVSITGDGLTNPLVATISVDGTSITGDGISSPFSATANSFTGVLVDGTTVTGDGITTALVSIANSFTGIITDATLTGNGYNTTLSVVPTLVDGVSITGDGVTTAFGATANSFTGVISDSTITGDGLNTTLSVVPTLVDGVTITGDGVTTAFGATANSFTGVISDSTITGDGLNTTLSVVPTLVDGVSITGDGVTTAFGATANSFTGVIVDGTTITGDGLNNPLVSLDPWSIVNSTSEINPGNYIIDSSGGGFTLTLASGAMGEWELSDAGFNAGTNNVTVGTTGQNFTNESGVQVAGPYVIDVDSAYLKIVNTDGSNNYYIASESNSSFLNAAVTVDGVTITGDGVGVPLSYVPQHNTLIVGKEEGVPFATGVTEINFLGTGVTAGSVVDGVWQIVIPGGGGGGGGSAITVYDEGSTLHTGIVSIDFVGSGVTATNVGPAITVTIPSITTGPTITGNGIGNPFNIPVSSDTDNVLIIGTGDGRLYVPSGAGYEFTGVLVDNNTITGDGVNTQLVATANSFTGVITDTTLTGNGYNTTLSVVPTLVDNITITGDGITTAFGATANSFTGVLVDNTTITGDGITTQLVSIADTFTGVLVDNITITGDGYNTALVSVPTGVIVNPKYYYGSTISGFSPSTSDLFFGDASYVEDDPFTVSDGTGTLTIPVNGRYAIDVEGSMSNNVSGTIVQILKNGSSIATTFIEDFGNDDTASFGLTYEGSLTSADTIAVRKNNSSARYDHMMLRLRELVTSASYMSHSGNLITINNDTTELVTSVDSITFTGNGVTATNIGNNVTVNITGGGGGGENFALNNLTLDGARTHDLNGNALSIVNSGATATVDIFCNANTGIRISSTEQTIGHINTNGMRLNISSSVSNMIAYSPTFSIVNNTFGGNAGQLRLYDSTPTYYSSFSASNSMSSNIDYILPTTLGGSGQVLTVFSDAGGQLIWSDTTGSFTGVSTNSTITGNGLTIPLGSVPILVDNVSITGNGITTAFGAVAGTGANFANSNLTLTSARNHNLNGNNLQITNAGGAANIIFRPTGTRGLRMDGSSAILGDSSIDSARILADYTQNIVSFSATTTKVAGSGAVTPGKLLIVDTGNSLGVGFTVNSGLASTTIYTLPDADGASGQYLRTNGNKALSWSSTTGSNFANSNLSFDATRSHKLDGNSLSITSTGGSPTIDLFYNTDNGLRLNSTEQVLGHNSITGVSLRVIPSTQFIEDNIVALSPNFSIVNNVTGFGQGGELRIYDGDASGYVAFHAPTGMGGNNHHYSWPKTYGSGNQVLSLMDVSGGGVGADAAGQLVWNTITDLNGGAWEPVETVGTLDLGSNSRRRTTSLSSNMDVAFTGVSPTGQYLEYHLEVIPGSSTLTIASANDPGAAFTQPGYSPYIVSFLLDSSGIPKYKGLS